MKKIFDFKQVVAIFAVATLFACTQSDFEIEQGMEAIKEMSLSSTRSMFEMEMDSMVIRDSVYRQYFVPYIDARVYAAIHCRGENARELDTIVPMTDNIDTLMYLVQYKNGWEVIAADKRGPLVIAMSEVGRFEENDTLSGFLTYLDAQKMYLKSMRYVLACDVESEAYAFWEMLHPKTNSQTRTSDEGYWTLYDSEHETTIEESGHMLQTKWGQDIPWDTCVPYNEEKPSKKCATGCVAVAGAQMLYYLHYKLGCPQTMYTAGGYIGDNVNYYASFLNPTVEAWDNMALTKYSTSGTELVSLMMAYIGYSVGMVYGEESGAYLNDLNDFFNSLGLSSTYASYNATTAWNSLKNNMPVIIGADRIDNGVYRGHAWVMDGWKTVTTNYTYYYGWVDTSEPEVDEGFDPGILQPMPDREMYTKYDTRYSTIISKSVLMNWGWDGSCDNIYCTLEGAWSPNTNRVYQYNKEMIYGFKKK